MILGSRSEATKAGDQLDNNQPLRRGPRLPGEIDANLQRTSQLSARAQLHLILATPRTKSRYLIVDNCCPTS
jgi:hypothetical protein